MTLIKLAPYIIVGVAVLSLVRCVHEDGKDTVQVKWDAEKLAQKEAMDAVKVQLQTREEAHKIETEAIKKSLKEAQNAYQTALDNARNDYSVRLRSSEARGDLYQRAAEGSASERRDLASHAARLDAALEEGRNLEREYRATLGLRDQQIRDLSQQILSDRKLFEPTEEKQ